mmetsp:Transcript_11669/g.37366  ORF Transcript_11669/g.37366 Transcript_11669/m.37366 type:complete len:208 (+) Transcript_11669:186-809(+)
MGAALRAGRSRRRTRCCRSWTRCARPGRCRWTPPRCPGSSARLPTGCAARCCWRFWAGCASAASGRWRWPLRRWWRPTHRPRRPAAPSPDTPRPPRRRRSTLPPPAENRTRRRPAACPKWPAQREGIAGIAGAGRRAGAWGYGSSVPRIRTLCWPGRGPPLQPPAAILGTAIPRMIPRIPRTAIPGTAISAAAIPGRGPRRGRSGAA